MDTIGFEKRVLSRVVDEYLRTRKNRDWPISLADAVKTVRCVLSSPSLSDRELVSMVATSAIAHGYNVAFDLSAAVIPPSCNPRPVKDEVSAHG